ncbi:MAG: ribonuclease III [Lachnospiraceae bacterium]|nr:ribonuclease III [Lachnospiraceae bacterium]
MEKLKELEKRIGYRFREQGLLTQALTHSSYANERRIRKVSDNERLEFLGDAVLELVSSEAIFTEHKEMPEGEMSKLRASMVCEQSLAYCARVIKLGEFLFLGKGERATGGAERDSILSDALEAVIGAIYLDGGFTNAKEFIHRFVLNDLETKKLFYDSKTILQEMIQGRGKGSFAYKLVSESGPDHNKTFVVQAVIDDTLITEGMGKTKKAAEQAAAYQAILELRRREAT